MHGAIEDIEPVDMSWTDTGDASITWSDGHRSTYAPAWLRRNCPCAECTGSHGTTPKAFKVLSSAQVQGAPRQVLIEAVKPVGNYAIAFTWGDGHAEGIYSWSFLRARCQCDACQHQTTPPVETPR